MQYYSEHGQDKFLDEEIFKKAENGFFVEVGAADGIGMSNTYFFEKYRHWSGLCIEPRISQFKLLKQNRSCILEHVCISDSGEEVEEFTEYTGKWLPPLSGLQRNFYPQHLEKVKEGLGQPENYHKEHRYSVKARRLSDILPEYGISKVDYCSIDTEGSELETLTTIDFERIHIKVISVENNYGNSLIKKFLHERKFELVKELGIPGVAFDEIYVNLQ